jgi:ribose transport system permease protein
MTKTSFFRRLINIEWLGLFLIVILAIVMMSIISPAFLSTYNKYVLSRDVAITVLVGFSQLVVLAIGQMNLSLGTIGGLVVVITGGLMEAWQVPVPIAVLIGITVGTVCGVLNGVIVVRTGINSFIVTIATSSIFLGINYGMTQAVPFYNLTPGFKAFGQARWDFFPQIAVATIIVTILIAAFFSRTIPGRQLLAVGGNLTASETSGIPVNRTVILAHALSGAIAAMAGILLMARLGQAQPTIGQNWLLPSFAAPIIGGVALAGGSVTIVGTVLAALLISIIQDALVLLNADPYYVQFLLGVLILAAVGFDRLAKRQRRV